MISTIINQLVDLSANRLPAAADDQAALVRIKYQDRFNDLSTQFSKITPLKHVSETLAAISLLLEQSKNDLCSFSNLPKLINQLEISINTNLSHSIKPIALVKDQTNAIIESLLIDLAKIVSKQHDLGDNRDFCLVGQGCFNWALSDYKTLILISKQNGNNPLESYKIRRIVAKALNAAGMEQPLIGAIASFPFLHAISEHGNGFVVSDILGKALSTYSLLLSQRFKSECFSRLGEFFLELQKIPASGYGKLIAGYQPELVGSINSFRAYLEPVLQPFLDPTTNDDRIKQYLIREKILNKQQLAMIAIMCRALKNLDEEGGIGNGDPNIGNYMFDENRGKVIALDWDKAEILSPSHVVARLLLFWKLSYPKSYGDLGNFLKPLLASYEPNTRERKRLIENGYALNAIESYRRLSNGISGKSNEYNDHTIQRDILIIKKIEALGNRI